ncbi:MAG: sirohydrochlorin chelatase [Mycobacteriales bacterium]
MDVLLCVAHGTQNSAGVHAVSQIVDVMHTARPALDVRLCWVELVEPDVPTALAAVPPARPVVVVPLLLSTGYHDRVDIPAAVRAARPDAVQAAPLGPDPLLARALADRLAEAGRRPGDAVVLAAAGSADPDAVAAVRAQAELLAAELDAPVTAAFGSTAEPDVLTAVAAARPGRVAIVPYLLAPGFFTGRLASAGADVLAAPLGAHPAVVELALRRYDEVSTRR